MLISDVIFVILTLVFITMLFIFVARQTSNTSFIEEKSAKEIALMIDAGKRGNIITLNFREMLKGNDFDENTIMIDNIEKKVLVKVGQYGHEYSFFNDVSVERRISGDFLTLEIK